MTVKLLTEHHLESLSLKGDCRGSSESTLVKMSIFWKSHAAAHLYDNMMPISDGSYDFRYNTTVYYPPKGKYSTVSQPIF